MPSPIRIWRWVGVVVRCGRGSRDGVGRALATWRCAAPTADCPVRCCGGVADPGRAAVVGRAGGCGFSVTALPLPIAIGFAVLARGLYDLATAVNRTLVWLILSALSRHLRPRHRGVGAIFHAQDARWLPWVAAAVVAVSFAPLRDLLQGSVNRLIFGRWDDPYRVLARLGQQLEASADVDRLLADVVAELETTLKLERVAIWDDSGQLLAGDAGAAPDDSEMALVAYHRRVGRLRFGTKTALRADDRRLLDDLARHLGGLLHTHRLNGELQGARERLVLAREEERRRLRRDLHDGLGPALAGHLVRLDLAARQLAADTPARGSLEKLRTEMQSTMSDVRRVVEGLRPPALDELGLSAALSQAVTRLTLGSIAARVEVSDLPALPAALEVAIYRIVSEAVTNLVRHAGASRCTVTLKLDGQTVCASIVDDGQGIQPGGSPGHGLDTMRERAEELGGRLEVSYPGRHDDSGDHSLRKGRR